MSSWMKPCSIRFFWGESVWETQSRSFANKISVYCCSTKQRQCKCIQTLINLGPSRGCLYMFIYMFICLYMFIYIHVYICFYMFIYVFICLYMLYIYYCRLFKQRQLICNHISPRKKIVETVLFLFGIDPLGSKSHRFSGRVSPAIFTQPGSWSS